MKDLAYEAFVDFPEGTPGRIPSDLAFQAAGVHSDVAFEAVSTGLILELVRQGLVAALLSPAVVPTDPGLRMILVSAGPTRIE